MDHRQVIMAHPRVDLEAHLLPPLETMDPQAPGLEEDREVDLGKVDKVEALVVALTMPHLDLLRLTMPHLGLLHLTMPQVVMEDILEVAGKEVSVVDLEETLEDTQAGTTEVAAEDIQVVTMAAEVVVLEDIQEETMAAGVVVPEDIQVVTVVEDTDKKKTTHQCHTTSPMLLKTTTEMTITAKKPVMGRLLTVNTEYFFLMGKFEL